MKKKNLAKIQSNIAAEGKDTTEQRRSDRKKRCLLGNPYVYILELRARNEKQRNWAPVLPGWQQRSWSYTQSHDKERVKGNKSKVSYRDKTKTRLRDYLPLRLTVSWRSRSLLTISARLHLHLTLGRKSKDEKDAAAAFAAPAAAPPPSRSSSAASSTLVWRQEKRPRGTDVLSQHWDTISACLRTELRPYIQIQQRHNGIESNRVIRRS